MSVGREDESWPSLAVVVPVFNEAASIEHACGAIHETTRRYSGRSAVIIVDDGSEDASAEIVTRLAHRVEDLHLVRHHTNMGYGEAVRSGAERARELGFEYVAFIDSDLTNPPADLLKIGRLAHQGRVYIKASRFVAGGEMRAVPLARRLASRLANIIASTLFGTRVRDVTNGFRAARTDLLCSWPTRERSFAVIVEEFAYALAAGIEPVEFPSSLSARGGAQRRSAFSYSPSLIWAYLRHPLRFRAARLLPPRS